jgi:hypothetical protein
MNLRGITGVHTGPKNPSIGAVTQDKTKHNINRVLLAAPRTATLALIRLNAFGLATVLYYKIFQFHDGVFWTDVISTWYNKGGDMDPFKDAIKDGAKKKVQGIKLLDLIKKRDGALANKLDKYLGLLYEAINYYRGVGIDLREREGVRGIGAAVATSATTLTAMEVILSLLEAITALLNSLPGKKEEDVIDNSAGSGSGAGAGVDKAGLSPILLVGLLGAVAFMAIKDRPKS